MQWFTIQLIMTAITKAELEKLKEVWTDFFNVIQPEFFNHVFHWEANLYKSSGAA